MGSGFRSDPIPEAPLVVGETPRRRVVTPFSGRLSGNDSKPSSESAMVFIRRPDGLMVPITADFPYTNPMQYVGVSDGVSFKNSWVNYGVANRVTSYALDFLGCAFIHGLVKLGTINQEIFFLPELYNDSNGTLVFATVSNSAFARFDHDAAGRVRPLTGSNLWYALSKMMFPTDGRMAWHDVGGGELAFENSWVNYGGAYTGARFAKDALGRVWIQGMVKNGADGVAIFTLPVGYRPTEGVQVLAIVDDNVIGKLQILSDGAVKGFKLGGTGTWTSITMMFNADGAATWREVGDPGEPTFENSWVNYGAPWDTAAFYKDAAGIVHLKGLIKSGTINQAAFTLPVGYRPKANVQVGILSNNAIGRMIISADGLVSATSGNNAWFVIHHSFIAEQ
ncbi:hypothetical protein LCGC14_1277110 [marine sediment metagenome]|uniref:Uncharacterized protein n=1 Tax=marine sediment metagenome TaxID=412755 RepID=A0A0F9KW94_9ZZZZ